MKVSRFTIPIYDYTVIYIESDDQIGEDVIVKRALKEVKAKDDQIVDTIRRMNYRMGGGEHYYNPDLLKSVIIIFFSKRKKTENTYNSA